VAKALCNQKPSLFVLTGAFHFFGWSLLILILILILISFVHPVIGVSPN
jgi:hypothetical protein